MILYNLSQLKRRKDANFGAEVWVQDSKCLHGILHEFYAKDVLLRLSCLPSQCYLRDKNGQYQLGNYIGFY